MGISLRCSKGLLRRKLKNFWSTMQNSIKDNMDQFREEVHKLNSLPIMMTSTKLYQKEKERILSTSTSQSFDKVDHEILLKKVKEHGIGGKIGRWIEEFLKERKFRVVVNGCMSDEAEVLSGVLQGTVLAALLFVIMISDIDENIKKSIVRSFVDDTRINRKINSPTDKKELQKHLNMMYKWPM